MILLYFLLGWLLKAAIPSPAEFKPQLIDGNISIGYGLALGDVDGDWKPDILLADKKQFVWYRNGDWKRFVMIDSLTEFDNVCIAARDINGDGKVEVAVGAQWNPSETGNPAQSGSVHFLIRPADPTQKWKAVELPHVPTIHRMKWARTMEGKYYIVVLPLHGLNNKNGEGEGVKLLAFEYPENPQNEWPLYPLETGMHMTHNFALVEYGDKEKTEIYIAGREGVKRAHEDFNGFDTFPGIDHPTGEIRIGKLAPQREFITTIEPMHGNQLVVYVMDQLPKRILLDDQLKEGHALATADFLGLGYDQVLAGWRVPNAAGKVGIRLYAKKDAGGTIWESNWVDDNGMACEDIQVGDLNGDGKPDIVASGRASKNLKIYWNQSGK
jgi:FG-GAP-like repeat